MNINEELKKYIEENIMIQYDKNNYGGHGWSHIISVIKRSFELAKKFNLDLNVDMIYVVACYHDIGYRKDPDNHEQVSSEMFIQDEMMKNFFTDEERKIIAEAIEDHRSSKEDEPRSVYGKLISSADRNTRIEIVFIRSFFVAHERMPETNIDEYLDYTIKRLSKKYDEENPENMFFEDQTYKVFIHDMRELLKNDEEFKNRYCEVNHISSRKHRVQDEQGEVGYIKILSRSKK